MKKKDSPCHLPNDELRGGVFMDKIEYHVEFFKCNGDNDARDLNNKLNEFGESGYILHSVVPKIDDGETVGYLVIYDMSKVDY